MKLPLKFAELQLAALSFLNRSFQGLPFGRSGGSTGLLLLFSALPCCFSVSVALLLHREKTCLWCHHHLIQR